MNKVDPTDFPQTPKKKKFANLDPLTPHIVFFDHRPYFTDAEISQTGSEKVHKFFGSTYSRPKIRLTFKVIFSI